MRVERDCERIREAFLGQPVNSMTTLVIVAAGIVVWQLPRMRWVGAAVAATGLGSLAFHGPMPPWSQWAHDVPLLWLVLLVAGWGRSWERWTQLPALLAISVSIALIPALVDPLAVVFTVAAVVSLLHRDRTWATIGPLLLLGAVALFGRLGATGGPLCNPDSMLQPHAVWHIGAAVSVAWWALGASARHSAEQTPVSSRR